MNEHGRTEAEEAELRRLIADQATDEARGTFQRPQRFGADDLATTSLTALQDADEGWADTLGASMSAEEAYLAELDDDGGEDFETRVLANLTDDERDLYLDVFGEGLSLREVEAKTGRSKSSIERDVKRLREKLQAVLAQEVAS